MSVEQGDQQETSNESVEQQDVAVEGEVVEPAESATETDSSLLDQHPEIRQKIEILEKQSQENLDKAYRAQAELDNVRKRSTRDIENAHKYALEKFLSDLLPILDSLELGVSAADQADEVAKVKEGMELTLKMFSDLMEKSGIAKVDPLGDKFDPEKHEAISMQEKEGVESGHVIAVMQPGYELNGRLIRPAMVMVAK